MLHLKCIVIWYKEVWITVGTHLDWLQRVACKGSHCLPQRRHYPFGNISFVHF